MEQKAAPKERIIFDDNPYFGSSGDALAIEDLMNRDGLTEAEVREQYTDHNLFEHAMEMRDFDYEEEIAALTAFFDGRTSDMFSFENPLGGNHLLVRGSVGRWDGPRSGITVYNSFTEAINTSSSRFGGDNVFADCEIQKVWDENGSLFIHGAHHDGSVTVEIRQLTDEGESVYSELSEGESIFDPITLADPHGPAAFPVFNPGEEGKLFNFMWGNAAYSAAPRYMEKAFGCPAEEWEEPEHSDTATPDLITGKWRVHLVMPGGHYGRGDALTYEQNDADKYGSGLPLVEFYDISQNAVNFPGGQFVSRYYMNTLLGTDSLNLSVPLRDMQAFSLDGGIPSWTVSGNDLKRVSNWLDEAYERLQEGADGKPDIGRGSYDKPVSLLGEAKASREASEALAATDDHGEYLQNTR